jgi:hypothetical protein
MLSTRVQRLCWRPVERTGVSYPSASSVSGAVLRESETGLLSWEIASVLLRVRGNEEDTLCHSTTR